MDGCKAHTTAAVVNEWKANCLSPAFLPAGTTCWLQWVDVYFASLYKHHHKLLYLNAEPVKRTAAMKRRMLHRLVADATVKTIESCDIVSQFTKLGYIDPVKSKFHSEYLKDFVYSPPQTSDVERLSDKEKAKLMAQQARDAVRKSSVNTLEMFGVSVKKRPCE
eukprot:PhM_4_TR1253/c2_g7_i1/m.81131